MEHKRRNAQQQKPKPNKQEGMTGEQVKSRVKRLKDDCGVNNIRDLMPGNKGGKKT